MTDLYTEIQLLANKLIRKYTDLDYNLIIEKLKDILDKYGDISIGAWNKEMLPNGGIYSIFTNKILDLPEKIIKGNGNTELIFKNHIMMQIFKIPCSMQPTMFNLLSISFYCGLLLAVSKTSDFPIGIFKAFNTLKINNLNNFVSEAVYKEALKTLPDDIRHTIYDSLLHESRIH